MLSGKQAKRDASIAYETEELRRKGRYTSFGTVMEGIVKQTAGFGLGSLFGGFGLGTVAGGFSTLYPEISKGDGVWSHDIAENDWNEILELDEAVLKNEEQFKNELKRLMPLQNGLIDSTLELSDDIIQLKQEIEENNRILREENR
jgi:hypothetical protein